MAEFVQTAELVTEFSGNKKVVIIDCTGVTGTAGTVTAANLSTIDFAVAQLQAVPDADVASVSVALSTISGNTVGVALYEDDGITATTQNPADFTIMLVGTAATTA